MDPNNDQRSVATLIGDLTQQATQLFQTEIRLARAELSEKISELGAGAVEIAAGGICLLAALLVLLQALVVALTKLGLGAGWSSLLVGIVVAVIGAILIRTGTNSFSKTSLAPERTQNQLQQDVRLAKEQVK